MAPQGSIFSKLSGVIFVTKYRIVITSLHPTMMINYLQCQRLYLKLIDWSSKRSTSLAAFEGSRGGIGQTLKHQAKN